MHKFTATAFVMLTALTFAHPVHADTALSNNAIVTDSSGKPVHGLASGTCVRTSWEKGENVCAPAQQTRTVTQTVLTDDERVVYFAFNSAELTPAAQNNLNAVAQRLAKADDVASAEIVGFADRIGSNDYNDKLSARRAAAVKDYLVRNGYLNVNVTQVRAMGENRPTTSCPTDAARNSQIACLSPDRRVEIELTYVDRMRLTSTR